MIGYLWSLGVVPKVVVFMFSKLWFARFSARDLLCSCQQWQALFAGDIDGATVALPWLVVIQILHCAVLLTLYHIWPPCALFLRVAVATCCDGRQHCANDGDV
ncbi:MAG: hypothetical protein ACR5LD_07610 [Symbiopectobacterium sp.]